MWNQRYNSEDYVYGTKPNDFLVQSLKYLPKSGAVLCLAEGEGRNAVWLAQQGYQVTAVDSSDVGLKKAQKLAEKHNVTIETIHADLADFEIVPEYWSGIVSVFCHLPAGLRVRLHQTCVHGLSRGGAFVLEAYTPAQIGRGTGGPPVPELMMTLADLKQELAGLTFLQACETERCLQEGALHDGIGAVVQIAAVKA